MKITQTALNKIVFLSPKKPPETGGILGSKNDDVITDVIFDKRNLSNSNKMCCYAPDVVFFNKQIERWLSSDINFKGVFHTHFAGVKTLSKADVKYVFSIMNNMPDEIVELHFPIFVVPNCELICYTASRTEIFEEKITII